MPVTALAREGGLAGTVRLAQRARRQRLRAYGTGGSAVVFNPLLLALRHAGDGSGQFHHDRLYDESEAIGDEEVHALQYAMDAIGNDLDTIERMLLVYPMGVVPRTGAVVSIDSEGAVLVHRGLLRDEDAKALRAQQGGAEGNEGAGEVDPKEAKRAGRVALADDFGEAGASALRAPYRCLFRRKWRGIRMSLAALVHRLAQRILLENYQGSALNNSAEAQDRLAKPTSFASKGLTESPVRQGAVDHP